MLEFPVIGPYLSSLLLSPRFSAGRTRFQKPSCIEVFEEEDLPEEPWEDEEEDDDDEEKKRNLTRSLI